MSNISIDNNASAHPMPTVDVYYARICGLCTKALDFFRSRGVTFTAYAVECVPSASVCAFCACAA